MRFWTYQNKQLTYQLLDGIPIIPNIERNTHITLAQRAAYRYLCDCYQKESGLQCTGLIFGYQGIRNQTELLNMLNRSGFPFGSNFPKETHHLLELEISEKVPTIVVDFYRFSDLIFCFENTSDDDCITLEEAKRDLFIPNSMNGNFELPVSHIPYILPEWVKTVHIPCSGI